MPNHLRHFAIHADDVERARLLYERVFTWTFEPWGPPEFYLIHTGSRESPGVQGALQRRQVPLTGSGMRGFECTIGVADLDDVITRTITAGGKLLSKPFTIERVGELAFIEDTEMNRVGVMQYDPSYPL